MLYNDYYIGIRMQESTPCDDGYMWNMSTCYVITVTLGSARDVSCRMFSNEASSIDCCPGVGRLLPVSVSVGLRGFPGSPGNSVTFTSRTDYTVSFSVTLVH